MGIKNSSSIKLIKNKISDIDTIDEHLVRNKRDEEILNKVIKDIGDRIIEKSGRMLLLPYPPILQKLLKDFMSTINRYQEEEKTLNSGIPYDFQLSYDGSTSYYCFPFNIEIEDHSVILDDTSLSFAVAYDKNISLEISPYKSGTSKEKIDSIRIAFSEELEELYKQKWRDKPEEFLDMFIKDIFSHIKKKKPYYHL